MSSIPVLTSDEQIYVTYAIQLGLLVIIAAAVIWLFLFVVQLMRKHHIRKQYGVAVSGSIKVKHAKNTHSIGIFQLQYPYWQSAKRNGTRDRRTNDMTVIQPKSTLKLDTWQLESKSPFELYDCVNDFRAHGATIPYNSAEQSKRQFRSNHIQSRRNINSIDSIIAQFQERPTDFEQFCADLFRSLGYQSARVTSPVRDGGFDIMLTETNGLKTIVECKCYARRHHIGRPIIQKLQGANAVVHAEKMMVVTTSSFTADAIEFASQTGVQLIDGTELVRLCHKAWGTSLPDSVIPASHIYLTRGDIMRHIPADMRDRY